MRREIDKLPEIPKLNPELIAKLTELCFRTDDPLFPDSSATVFVFGTAVSFDKASEVVLNTIKHVTPKKVIFSGGMPKYPDSYKLLKPESKLLYDHLHESLPKTLEVHFETTSNNCIENVQNALPFLEDSQNIFFVTKNFGACRNYLTLKKILPQGLHKQVSFDAMYPEDPTYITRKNWHQTPYTSMRVWGEFLRIAKYGKRGDIAYDEVKTVVEDILKKTGARVP